MSETSSKRHVSREVLIAAITGAGGLFFSWLMGWAEPVYTWLRSPIEIAHWWFSILLGVLITSIILAIRRMIKVEPIPEHYEYREDCFDGIRWRWEWDKSTPTELKAYCVKCDRLMNIKQVEKVYGKPEFTIYCQVCNDPRYGREGIRHFEQLIMTEIDLKKRNKYWKKSRPDEPGANR